MLQLAPYQEFSAQSEPQRKCNESGSADKALRERKTIVTVVKKATAETFLRVLSVLVRA